MIRRFTIISLIFSSFFILGCFKPEDARPNIVIVIIDTLRADKLGSYGSKAQASKELDALASEGVVFENAISQASWTRASVASLLSGMFPGKIGLEKEKWDLLHPEVETLAEMLQKTGYRTIGLTANPQLNKVFGFAQGFSEYVESNVLFSWMKKEEGKVKARKDKAVRGAEDIFADARELLKKETGQPIYLQMLIMEVHAHHRIKPEEIDQDLSSEPDAAYLQAVRNATRPVSHFIQELKNTLGENTVFIVTADHGEGLNDHPSLKGSKGHGNFVYRSHVQVPLIFLGSKKYVGGGKRISGVATLLDIMPTVLALTGSAIPSDLDGIAHTDALLLGSPLPPRYGYSETSWRKDISKRAVTDGEWLYVENRDETPGTLPAELQGYHEAQDGSVTDVSGKHPEIFTKLKNVLAEHEKDLQGSRIDFEDSKDGSAPSSEEIEQLKSLGYLQ